MKPTFDATYVIGLPRAGRLDGFHRGFPSDWEVPYPETFKAIDAQRVPIPAWWTELPAMWGCNQSHIAVIAQALSAGHSQILIFEDDCRFVPGSWPAVAAFLADVPDDADGAMFGGQVSVNDGHTTPITPRCSKCVQVERLHAYALTRSGMEKFYRLLCERECLPNDYIWGDAQESGALNVYRIEPFVAYQADGRSSISGRIEANRIWDERVDVRLRDPKDIQVVSLVCPFEVLDKLRDAGVVSNGGESPPFMAILKPGAVERTERNVANTLKILSEDDPPRAQQAIDMLRRDAAFHRSSSLVVWHPNEAIPYPGAPVVFAETFEDAERQIKEATCGTAISV